MNMTEHKLASWDNVELFYRAWLPEKPTTRALFLFHRGHEHSGRWQETVKALALEDCAVFAWDQRGHGHSPGPRGSAENLATIVKDADVFARHVCKAHGVKLSESIVLAHSVGAVIAAAWVHDYAPPIRGLILAAPALRVKLYVPLAIPSLRLKQKLLGPGFVKSYVKSKVLTHDVFQQAAYDADPLIFRQIAVNILLDLYDISSRLLDDAGAMTTPTLLLAAEKDWIVELSTQREFFRRLGSKLKQMEFLPGFYHAIFQESDRAQVIQHVKAFIKECFDRPASCDGLLDADKGGFTRTEYDLLRGPGGLRWAIVRAMVKVGALLSQGMRLGRDVGFDSGATLDYVYENKPRGLTAVGRLIDYFYLNSIGWRGIRIRRQNLRKLLRQCIEQTHLAGRPVVLLDIAAGAGRYVLETMKELDEIAISAVLRDYKQANLDAARALASTLGVKNVEFVQGDAFDRASLAAITPKPTIAIVSGLYELFPSNEPLRRSLAGIADALGPSGRLIYTCQPWHPQVEFIARALTNREGQPWIMRRRTQGEMDALVREAGFEKTDQFIDPFGVFTVSIAQRASS